ncbi:MAG: hypothetical protein NC489_09115 [Ruminococcus flavefaciens]|nr:hypothetical protein [Ruminococcus flavefaciens]
MEEKRAFITPELEAKLYQMAVVNREAGVPQENFVMEEASEFVQAYMKIQRDKDTEDHKIEEAMDIFSALLVFFTRYSIPMETVLAHVDRKVTRALDRYHKNGEV